MIRVHLRQKPFNNDEYNSDLRTYTKVHETGVSGVTDSHGSLFIQDKSGNLIAGYHHYLWHSFNNNDVNDGGEEGQ